MSLLFPDRFGAITADDRQPTLADRMTAWIQRSAPIRVAASLSQDHALDQSPNLVPLRRTGRTGRTELLVATLVSYCATKRHPAWVVKEAVRAGMFRMRFGASMASAIQSAKVRADFVAQHGRDPDAA